MRKKKREYTKHSAANVEVGRILSTAKTRGLRIAGSDSIWEYNCSSNYTILPNTCYKALNALLNMPLPTCKSFFVI